MIFASTKNLNLRELREFDVDRLLDLINDPAVMRSGPGYPRPRGPTLRKELESSPDQNLLTVIVEAKEPLEKIPDGASPKEQEDALFVGMVGLSLRFKKNREATLEINLVDKWRGRGFGTEVMLWLVSYAFQQLALHRLSLGVLAGNSPAIAVYKKVGFVEEGRSRKSNWQDGKWQDVVYMGLLEEEWLASAQQA